MIQDYPDEWIDEAIAAAAREVIGGVPSAKKNKCRAKMIDIREQNRIAPIDLGRASHVMPSDESDIRLSLKLRAGDILGIYRQSGWMPVKRKAR